MPRAAGGVEQGPGSAILRGNYVMKKWHILLATGVLAAAASAVGVATPGAGIAFNFILGLGRTQTDIHEHVVRLGVPGVSDNWQVKLKTQGDSDIVVQDVALAPNGYSGWHSHPGVLIGTVTEGAVEWYDEDCVRHFYSAGQSFTESDTPHYLRNTGAVNARLLISYIVQKAVPRRIDEAAPACAAGLGLP